VTGPELCARCREPPRNTTVAGWNIPMHSGSIPSGWFGLEYVWQIHPYVPPKEKP
jgi:hypothetical protein